MKNRTFKRHSIFTLLFISLVIHISNTLAQDKIATTAAQFLGIPVGARELAMGAASVATANDVSSIYYNPGAFSQAGRSEVLFSSTDWLVGTKMRWLVPCLT